MDQLDNNNSTIDFQQNMLLEMMKQHISSGLPFQYETNCKRFNSNYSVYSISFYIKDPDQILQQNSDVDVSLNIENEQDENDEIPMPIVYKKRGRIKFTQEQV
jgi:hypothetical protein